MEQEIHITLRFSHATGKVGLNEIVYEAIKEGLLKMDLPGLDVEDRIDERGLAEKLGVSRAPLNRLICFIIFFRKNTFMLQGKGVSGNLAMTLPNESLRLGLPISRGNREILGTNQSKGGIDHETLRNNGPFSNPGVGFRPWFNRGGVGGRQARGHPYSYPQ